MKKTLLYTIASIGLLVTSCQEKHDIEFVDLGTEFLISDTGYTSLDAQTSISVTNQQKNLSSVEIMHLGGLTTDEDAEEELIPFDPPAGELGPITVSDGAGSLDLSSAQLGMTEIGYEAFFQLDASFNGKPLSRDYSIVVSNPNGMMLNSSNIKESEPAEGFFYVEEFKSVNDTTFKADGTTVDFLTPTGVIEEHKINVLSETAFSNIETAVSYTKELDGGTYVEVLNESPAATEYNSTFDYAIGDYGDTTYVKLETSANGRTATEIAKIVVTGKAFDYMDAALLSIAKPDTALYSVEVDKDVWYSIGHLTFDGSRGFSSTDAKFMKVPTDTKVGNLSEVVDVIGTAGSASISDVSIGDMYAFYFSGKNEDDRNITYYGVITITDVTQNDIGDPENGFSYSYSMTEKEI